MNNINNFKIDLKYLFCFELIKLLEKILLEAKFLWMLIRLLKEAFFRI